jgi:hypothetical protein
VPRDRSARIHFVVSNLVIPRGWRVGGLTLSPAGRLLAQLDAQIAATRKDWPDSLIDSWRQELVGSRWATIAVPVRVPAPPAKLADAAVDDARNRARDVIAGLRIFQSTTTTTNVDIQTFGLDVDIGSVIESRWLTDGLGRAIGRGWQVHGVPAHWEFTAQQLEAFARDEKFRYLDAALAAPVRTEWQRRVVVAARTRNLATVVQRPATRITLLATAVEALLGNDFAVDAQATGGPVLAKRAAYLSCGSDVQPPNLHGPARLACDFLTTKGDLRTNRNLFDPQRGGWACSWYGDVRDLYDARNEALHAASDRFTHREASHFDLVFERLYVATLGWLVMRSPTALSDLDADIAALPHE